MAGDDTDPDNQKLAQRVRQHRQQWLVFLYEDHLAPTHAEGEQAIRPAVGVRQLSAGHRNWTGADAHASLTSVIRTGRQHGQSVLDLIIERRRHPTAAWPAWLSGLAPAGTTTTAERATGPP